MRRGEVWWANLQRPIRRRPVLILTRDAVLPTRGQATVAMITTTVHGLDVEVPLGRQDGMPMACVINLDNILTISTQQLADPIIMPSPRKMAEVREAIIAALALEE